MIKKYEKPALISMGENGQNRAGAIKQCFMGDDGAYVPDYRVIGSEVS